MENYIETLELKRITNFNFRFHIPSYQRGYRWDTTQVQELLEDLFEFMKEGGEKYCLQPVVVKLRPDERWEVIDGQQRLTTIYILLSRLKKSITSIRPYELTYETRPGSEKFLQQLSTMVTRENIDYYHISTAYKYIHDWIEEKVNHQFEIALETDLFSTLMNKVEIIWFQINNESNPIDIFTRINIGKIPLTSSELVKAVFLSKSNLAVTENDQERQNIYLRQLEISSEWDRMEAELHNPQFWGFVHHGKTDYGTRIDFILELVARPQQSGKDDRYAVFRHYYKKMQALKHNPTFLQQIALENRTLIDEDWQKIKGCFSTLKEWFDDHKYYHLIGYLIYTGYDIKSIYDEYMQHDKPSFQDYLHTQIATSLHDVNIYELRYGSNNTMIKRVLALFNIISTLHVFDRNIRFPFDRLKDRKRVWSLEHIHAQNSKGLKRTQYYAWLKDHLAALVRVDNLGQHDALKKQIAAILKRCEEKDDYRVEEPEFSLLFDQVVHAFTHQQDVDAEIHEISNLALLDKDSNSSLNNSIFEVKRDIILRREKQGEYIPLATRNVFLKYYTPYPEHLHYWTQDDRDAYVNRIAAVVSSFRLKSKPDYAI